MSGFEQGFADAERAAALTAKSALDVAKSARQLEKAAKTGSINALRKAQADLDAALGILRQEVANAGSAWPFRPEEEEVYLKDHYAAELKEVAANQGLQIFERDERLIAHPSILRVLPTTRDTRAVQLDKKQISTIRPSYLATLLVANQKKPARFNTGNFLNSIYAAYSKLVRNRTPQSLTRENRGPTVPLSEIYELFTIAPGSGRDYSKTDFARDLYRLDTDGPRETRNGARLYFHSGRQSSISFVGPDGHIITYHGIEFSGGK